MSKSDTMHHIACRAGDVGRYVLLPGDPGRVPMIAALLDDTEEVAYNREYRTFTGTLLGEKVSVTSTGMGCPSTAIAVEELAKIGADTFIRVGTAGAMQPFIEKGDLVIAWGAIRDEFTSQQYEPLAYPAVADLDVTLSLRRAARERGLRCHVGITHSKDSFFGQHEPERMPVARQLQDRWSAWVQGGALSSEMEASTILVVARILRCRAGGIMLCDTTHADLSNLLHTAVAGVEILIDRDRRHDE
jgi:uridine phosphorylase